MIHDLDTLAGKHSRRADGDDGAVLYQDCVRLIVSEHCLRPN